MQYSIHPTNEERHMLGRVALGKAAPDLIVRGAQVVNVFTRDLEVGDVWIWRRWIARMTRETCAFECPTFDATGKVLIPGLIDGHIHVESSLLDPVGFAKLALKCGVTTIFTDYHEVGAIAGATGLRAMYDASSGTPLKCFAMIPMRLPFHPEIQRTLATLSPDEASVLLRDPRAVGLTEVSGETIREALESGEPGDLRLLTEAVEQRKLPEGHLFRTLGADLDACIGVGVASDHEPRRPEELEEKIRKGLFVMLRSGTLATEVETLVGALVERGLPTERVGLVTDDILATDMRSDRYMLYKIRVAVEQGIPPIEAIRMATYNVASHYRLEDLLGCLKPGACADMVIVDSLDTLTPEAVISSGLVLDDAFFASPSPAVYPPELLQTIERAPLDPARLADRLRVSHPTAATVQAIQLNEQNRFTELLPRDVPVRNGRIVAEEADDLCYLVCANRRHNDAVGLGFLSGYGLRDGALAVSMAHDHHSIVALGRTLADLTTAANRVIETQGGVVYVRHGEVDCEVKLPLAGLMATDPFADVVCGLNTLHERLRAGGARWRAPLFFVFWLGMEVAPRYRITDRGVIDTTTCQVIDVIDA